MKIELLAGSVEKGTVSGSQHLTCFIVDGNVALDAGSLASAIDGDSKQHIRSVVLSHAHLDHIAGLPLFIDDLFDSLTDPVAIYASRSVIDVLENDVFNWRVYPKFSELQNASGPVMEYREIREGERFMAGHLNIEPVEVNHKVPSFGFIVSDGRSVMALTGDTAKMQGFWERVNSLDSLDALLIECAFPNRMESLAEVSHHLTPALLKEELEKFNRPGCPVFAVNLKPMYQSETKAELGDLNIPMLEVFPVGREVEF